jgi:putative phosphoribosyl transferase
MEDARMSAHVFRDRRDAGRQLAVMVATVADASPAPHTLLVLGLPRGGVPVAFEVATLLAAPLDVLPVRKLGLPGNEEVAMGAIAALNGEVAQVVDYDLLQREPAAALLLDRVIRREYTELLRRRRRYRGERPPLDVAGRDVILVDDGLATGATMRAAVLAVRQGHARRIVVAVPVGAADRCARLRTEADACVCVVEAGNLFAVGAWYAEFSQTSDEEVATLLAESERRLQHQLPAASGQR